MDLRVRMSDLAEAFEDELRRFVEARPGEDGAVENLHDATAYALGSDIADPAQRGKRIRPVLCLLSAEALGADRALAMPFALAIELMHNFALVHDDMEDGDVMRRGRDAVWVRYGSAHGINIGDYLLVHTMTALTDWGTPELDAATRFRLVGLLARALDHTHIGQALEINARGRRGISEEDYLRIVREKTGHYLAAPIQGGALVAGADDETLEIIGEMAQFLGPMFQIIDDIIDLTDGKGREAIGSDIREGKRSYLVAFTAGRCTDFERERLFDILDTPRGETTHEQIEELIDLFGRHRAIEAGRRYCEELYEAAGRHVERLPERLAEPLGEVLNLLVSRRT